MRTKFPTLKGEARGVLLTPHPAIPPQQYQWHATLTGILDLMTRSARHRAFTIADFERLVLPPLLANQAVILNDGQRIVAFGSVAALNEEAAQGYRDGTRKLQPGDWNSGDEIWLMDAIAPFGHARQLTTAIRAACRARGLAGRHIHFRRTYPDGSTRISKALL